MVASNGVSALEELLLLLPLTLESILTADNNSKLFKAFLMEASGGGDKALFKKS